MDILLDTQKFVKLDILAIGHFVRHNNFCDAIEIRQMSSRHFRYTILYYTILYFCKCQVSINGHLFINSFEQTSVL